MQKSTWLKTIFAFALDVLDLPISTLLRRYVLRSKAVED